MESDHRPAGNTKAVERGAVKAARGAALTPRRAVIVTVAAGLAAACLAHFGLSSRGVIEGFFVAVLAVVSGIDFERRIIPNRIVLPATGIVLAAQIACFSGHTVEWIAAASGAAGVLMAFALLYPPGMGMGDVKLALLLGAALGRLVAPALVVGLVAAAAAGLAVIARRGIRARRQSMPLGPFLAFGSIIAVFFGHW